MPILEKVCSSQGLTLTLKGTLAQYPRSIHWHYQPGRLEITFWAQYRRILFTVHPRRTGAWISAAMEQIVRSLEAIFHSERGEIKNPAE
jgi:hypothetical protein